MKLSEFDVVTPTEDIPENGLMAGMVGTVVDVYITPFEAYEVEFCDSNGMTVALQVFLPHQIKRIED